MSLKNKTLSYSHRYKSDITVKLIFLAGAIAVSGCGAADIAKVREYSSIAVTASERSKAVGQDFYPSCLRQAQYVPIVPLPDAGVGASENTRVNLNEVRNQAEQELERERQRLREVLGETAPQDDNNRSSGLQGALDEFNESLISGSTDPLVVRNEIRKLCDVNVQGIGPKFANVNGTLIYYIIKLGEVAGTDITSFDSEFSAIRTSTSNLTESASSLFSIGNTIPTSQIQGKVSSVLGIFEFIFQGIIKGKQRKVLKDVILSQNANVKDVVDALKTVVNEYYIAVALRNEEASLDAVYTTYINGYQQSQEFISGQSSSKVINFLIKLEDLWIKGKNEIQSRRELAQAYVGTLNSISAGHSQLYKIFSDGKEPTSEQVNEILSSSKFAIINLINKSDLVVSSETQYKLKIADLISDNQVVANQILSHRKLAKKDVK